MLQAVRLSCAIFPPHDNAQMIAELGRSTNALLGALGVLAAMLAVYLAFPLQAPHERMWLAFAGGMALAFHPLMVVNAHYLKEDVPLVFGLMVALMMWTVFWRWPSWLSACALGYAGALAVSSKYIGAIAPALALAALIAWPREDRGCVRAVRVGVYLLGFVTLLVLINRPAISAWQEFKAGLDYEFRHSVMGHGGVLAVRERLPALRMFASELGWPALALLLCRIGWLIARGRRANKTESAAGIFTGVYLIALSFSPILGERYLLPAVAAALVLAGLCLADFLTFSARYVGPWNRMPCVPVALVIIASILFVRDWRLTQSFRNDSRLQCQEWLVRNLPPGSQILQSSYVGLPEMLSGGIAVKTSSGLPQFDLLRKMRYNYVAVSEFSFSRFFDPDQRPVEWYEAQFAGLKRAHTDLFRKAKLVWQGGRKGPSSGFTNPVVLVYQVPGKSAIPAIARTEQDPVR